MNSMTGFGRGCAVIDGRELVIEVKSVNHRFLDISYKSPRAFTAYEESFKTIASGYFNRGHLDVYVTYQNTRQDSKSVRLDDALLAGYEQAVKQAKKRGVSGKITVSDLLRIHDMLCVTAAQEDSDALLALFTQAAQQACAQLAQMRATEGAKMYADLSEKLAKVEQCRNSIAALAAGVSTELQKKMRARIAELLGDVPVDEQRLAQEIAINADRLAIDEELVRLKAHTDNARRYMTADEPIGRKLEFMLQEINREANTIGSKAMNVEVQTLVVEIKGELEKLREQVQNVE